MGADVSLLWLLLQLWLVQSKTELESKPHSSTAPASVPVSWLLPAVPALKSPDTGLQAQR